MEAVGPAGDDSNLAVDAFDGCVGETCGNKGEDAFDVVADGGGEFL